MKILRPAAFCACFALLSLTCIPALRAQISAADGTVIASGLNAPRGLHFGPDGQLYVALAGTGGPTSTGTACAQVVAPVGPYTGGATASIIRIGKSGTVTTVASGLPSSVDAMGDLQGVADLTFVGDRLYALLAGGGCSHGNTIPNALIRVNRSSGSWNIVANLSQFLQNHPVLYPNAGDFEPDGTFYSMVFWNNHFYAVEPNHGQVLAISLDGHTTSVLDVSESEGHVVPTAIAERDGNFYLGNLDTFPITPTASRIMTLTHDTWWNGRFSVPGLEDPQDSPFDLRITGSRAGFTTVVSTAFGPDGLLYALELSAAAGYPGPNNGKVVRLLHSGEIEDVVTELTVPTAMTFGPDGSLYISNFGAAGPGAGQILKVAVQPGY
ncbi:MAG: ScyD/ScyE family protein [Acidobacteriaceae bacterium]